MKWVSVLSIVCLLWFVVPVSSLAIDDKNWEELDQISDQALQMTKHERYKDAKLLLQHFSNKFLTVKTQEKPFSMNELRVITFTHNNALDAVTSSTVSHEEKILSVTKFRLVIDAIRSEHQPMWTEMENPMMTTFNQMKQTILAGDEDTFQYHLNHFLTQYETIHPSITVDVEPVTVEKLESHITFLDDYRAEDLKTKTRLQQLEQMEVDLKTLFSKMTKDEADPSLIWVMITTGSLIIMTLSYVGWRKYSADKQKKQSQRDFYK